jgi:hypothetical protein
VTTAAPVEGLALIESDGPTWLHAMLPTYLRKEGVGAPVWFADPQLDFWTWVWQIQLGIQPDPLAFLGIWPRGWGKSTSAEMAVSALAAMQRRNYALYISESQEQADEHVANVGAMLTSPSFTEHYPEAGTRRLDRYGPKAWRRNRLQTQSGFTIDAAGLDASVRGLKTEEHRPDLLVLDDIDGLTDTAAMTNKKMNIITRTILPAMSADAAVIGIQNLIKMDSVFDRLVAGRADFLRNRRVSGPHPAVRGLQYEGQGDKWVITAGTATWEGMDLEACERKLNSMGPDAFRAECQHETRAIDDLVHGGFSPEVHAWRAKSLPTFKRLLGGLDFGGEGATANHTAGLVGGETDDGRIILLAELRIRGINTVERQEAWMQEQEQRWKGLGSIEWEADGTENGAIQLMRRDGFRIRGAKKGGRTPMREARVRLVGHRLAVGPDGRPGLYYLEELVEFYTEIMRFRREQPKFEGDVSARKIIDVEDHLMSCLEYMVELADADNRPADPNARGEVSF